MLAQIPAASMPLDKFQADLQSICGSFGVVGADEQGAVHGHIGLETRAGIEMAHVAKDVQMVRRTRQDIKRDPGDNFFLIVQEEGHAFMHQHDTTRMMKPGDMMLIDSAAPSEFTFFGKFSRQLSLHLPRPDMCDRFGNAATGGHFVQRSDHHALAIHAILAKAFDENVGADQTLCLKEAIFGMIGAVLYERAANSGTSGINSAVTRAQILERGIAYLDRCFTDSSVTTQTLSDSLGVPPRQVQRAFALAGTTPTDYLLKKRFEKVCQMLEERRNDHNPMLVSSIAYSCGFNDVSYFNRQFRRMFGCAPGQFGTDSSLG